MPHLPLPLTLLATALVALLPLPLTTIPTLARTPPCSITVGNVWSDDPGKTFTNNKLTVEEGAYWELDLTSSCTGLQAGERPAVSIIRPSPTATLKCNDRASTGGRAKPELSGHPWR